MSTDLTLKYRSASGDAQWVHLGDLRADGTMTLLASEHPAGLRGSAAPGPAWRAAWKEPTRCERRPA